MKLWNTGYGITLFVALPFAHRRKRFAFV